MFAKIFGEQQEEIKSFGLNSNFKKPLDIKKIIIYSLNSKFSIKLYDIKLSFVSFCDIWYCTGQDGACDQKNCRHEKRQITVIIDDETDDQRPRS